MSSSPLCVDGAFGRFADDLLELELPDLPASQRADTVAFVCRRTEQVPTPLKLGILVLSVATGLGQRLSRDRTTRFLSSTSLPFVAELSRMVRSLGFAFVWETWPSTSPTGGQPAGGTAPPIGAGS